MKIILLIGALAFSTIAVAQHKDHDHSSHEGHAHHWVHDHQNELGLALNPTYMISEGEFAPGLHLHYVHYLKNTKWGAGLGYEQIYDDHSHRTAGVILAYRPIPRLVFIAAPGVTFEAAHPDELAPAIHFESTYEFMLGPIHLGPAVEYAWDPNDQHFSIGLHFGYGF